MLIIITIINNKKDILFLTIVGGSVDINVEGVCHYCKFLQLRVISWKKITSYSVTIFFHIMAPVFTLLSYFRT